MPNKLGQGQGPAAPEVAARRFLTSLEKRAAVAVLAETHEAEIAALESPVAQVEATMLVVEPFLKMLAGPLAATNPLAGAALSSFISHLDAGAKAHV